MDFVSKKSQDELNGVFSLIISRQYRIQIQNPAFVMALVSPA